MIVQIRISYWILTVVILYNQFNTDLSNKKAYQYYYTVENDPFFLASNICHFLVIVLI